MIFIGIIIFTGGFVIKEYTSNIDEHGKCYDDHHNEIINLKCKEKVSNLSPEYKLIVDIMPLVGLMIMIIGLMEIIMGDMK